MKNKIQRFGQFNENESTKISDEDLYIAQDGDNKLIIKRDFLKPDNGREIVDKLNDVGFSLGSGHDKVEIFKKKSETGEIYYVLVAEPYPGRMEDFIYFYKYEPDIQ